MFLVDLQLYVAYHCPTTPTDYPRTRRDTSVGPPASVNIDFYGYLRFFSISLSEIYGYSMPLKTFLVNN